MEHSLFSSKAEIVTWAVMNAVDTLREKSALLQSGKVEPHFKCKNSQRNLWDQQS